MPRLSTFLLRKARSIHPLLPLLLRTCRDLQSARNELRWLREHVTNTCDGDRVASKLRAACLQRSIGRPLQYILGSQPFGDLDILCRPGVLIPRPETETYTTHLAQTLIEHANTLLDHREVRILDLCTGTGCIPLLLHSLLADHCKNLHIRGIDVSKEAVTLARKNLRWNISQGGLKPRAVEEIVFEQGDVLDEMWLPPQSSESRQYWDIIVSNPPYISPSSFARDTERSVRNYEPRLALVPPDPSGISEAESGDTFYPTLLKIGQKTKCKILIMEVADQAQALRVAHLAKYKDWRDGIDIWCDDLGLGNNTPDILPSTEGRPRSAYDVKIYGRGNARAVVYWRSTGARWLGCGDAHVTDTDDNL